MDRLQPILQRGPRALQDSDSEKLEETVLLKKTVQYMDEQDLLGRNQHAFCKGTSCLI